MKSDKDIIAELRQTIPSFNLANFDVEAADLLKWIERKPEHRDAITSMFWDRVQLMRIKDVSKAPPCLINHDSETMEDYLARCYKAGGYKTV
jgi:hypothetical protein